MVEVVQDLLDHVTYAGGVGRRRVDAVRGIGVGTLAPGSADCAVLAEDPSDPKGPRIARMQDLMFHEMLDKPFEEKAYHLQLEEFAYRGERIIAQVDQKIGEIQRMIGHDVLARSKGLPNHLKSVNDELRRAHQLVCAELEEVWRMRFEPFFYPSEEANTDAQSEQGSFPGGWLDLDDMFLTGRLLIRYLAELVHLIGTLAHEIPHDHMDRRMLKAGRMHPALQGVVAAFVERVPWMCASLADSKAKPVDHGEDIRRFSKRRSSLPTIQDVRDMTLDLKSETHGNLPLNLAINALDRVLTVHMKLLVSDLHRTMYQTFVRICAAYARWKHAFARERELSLQSMEKRKTRQRRHTQIEKGQRWSTAGGGGLRAQSAAGNHGRGDSILKMDRFKLAEGGSSRPQLRKSVTSEVASSTASGSGALPLTPHPPSPMSRIRESVSDEPLNKMD